MGWKAFNLFASSKSDGYFASFPKLDSGKAREFVATLDEHYESCGVSSLEVGLYPKSDDELYVGAFEHGLILGNIPLAEEVFQHTVPKAVAHACRLYPGTEVLVVMLHSVVNLFGYAFFRGGRLMRARAGSAEDGIIVDEGAILDFERPLFAESVIEDGQRVFRRKHGDETHTFDEAAFGEEFVMEACRPFLGCRLSQFDLWDLKMELFRRDAR